MTPDDILAILRAHPRTVRAVRDGMEKLVERVEANDAIAWRSVLTGHPVASVYAEDGGTFVASLRLGTTTHATRDEAEAAVVARLRAEGWVLVEPA